jgi:hypothetical protein
MPLESVFDCHWSSASNVQMMQSVGYDIASSGHRDQINTSGSAEIHLGSRTEPDGGVDFHSNIYRINDRVGNALVPVHSCVARFRRAGAFASLPAFFNSGRV